MLTDLYPSRLTDPKAMFPRFEAVIHSRNQDRWDGPLDEVALSRYERDALVRGILCPGADRALFPGRAGNGAGFGADGIRKSDQGPG